MKNWKRTKQDDSDEEDEKTTRIKPRGNPRKRNAIRWRKPENGVVKLNFDGAKSLSGSASAGFVIRDDDGRVLACDARRCGTISAIQAEAVGLQLGLLEARRLGFRRVAVEGDCLAIVNAINGAWSTPWEIEILMSDALRLLSLFETFSVTHIFREANKAADRLTRMALESASSSWSSDLEFQTLVRRDALGWWYNRS